MVNKNYCFKKDKSKKQDDDSDCSNTEPKLEDFYDTSDPRGCSTSEYNAYLEALANYKKEA